MVFLNFAIFTNVDYPNLLWQIKGQKSLLFWPTRFETF